MQDTSASDRLTAAPVQNRSRSGGLTLFAALIAFLLGGAAVAWLTTNGHLGMLLPPQQTPAPTTAPLPAAELNTGPNSSLNTADQLKTIGTVEGRLAMLEDRISRIDFQTNAAAGNAGRAEGLLIAFAARRMIDRGEPLGHIADQLRLRFTNAQPRAVDTVINFSRKPVTLDSLAARLGALSPELVGTSNEQSVWLRAKQEFIALFEIRRDSAILATPAARIERARLMLTARRIDAAIAEIERLPGADAAKVWIADAKRFDETQKALDLLETTAMLAPKSLLDAGGQTVDQPSPLAPAATSSTDPLAPPVTEPEGAKAEASQ